MYVKQKMSTPRALMQYYFSFVHVQRPKGFGSSLQQKFSCSIHLKLFDGGLVFFPTIFFSVQ